MTTITLGYVCNILYDCWDLINSGSITLKTAPTKWREPVTRTHHSTSSFWSSSRASFTEFLRYTSGATGHMSSVFPLVLALWELATHRSCKAFVCFNWFDVVALRFSESPKVQFQQVSTKIHYKDTNYTVPERNLPFELREWKIFGLKMTLSNAHENRGFIICRQSLSPVILRRRACRRRGLKMSLISTGQIP